MVICLARAFPDRRVDELVAFPDVEQLLSKVVDGYFHATSWTLIDPGRTLFAFQVVGDGLHFLGIVTHALDLIVEPESMVVKLLLGDPSMV